MAHDFLTLIAPNQTMKVKGLFAVCSAHTAVLTAAMQKAVDDRSCLLVEATPNQVNQFGGYSGMTPAGFRQMVETLAANCGLPLQRLILGADHLGPYVWRNENARSAMRKALELTRAFVAAGFSKLHLDAGMPLGDDSSSRLSDAVVVRRTIQMMIAAEETRASAATDGNSNAYVIGTEAPVPGGGVEEDHAAVLTSPDEVARFLECCRRELQNAGRADIWRNVAAVVMQPGVDFGDRVVIDYDSLKAAALSDFVKKLPEHMTCEVHATDYQSASALAALVDDGFRILKVGPCLTFAYRQAIFALARIETDWLARKKSGDPSRIDDVMERVMLAQPEHWRSHYHGSSSQMAWLRRNSLRDRIRYYWNHPDVTIALERLMRNLSFEIPRDLLSFHWPDAPADVPDTYPQTLITEHIHTQLQHYVAACKGTMAG